MTNITNDHRVVLTLDAGGTNLRFCGMRAGKRVTEIITLKSHGDNLDLCLANIVDGFARSRAMCPSPPVAISFAFPGPADYKKGIIGDLGNLPSFRGGVALGPILQEKFKIPVFINNDGNLFALGESIGGFLPYVNTQLERARNHKCYQNLLGLTLGTGFGGGIVLNGNLILGDNSLAGEVWLLRDKSLPNANVEQSVSIRAVRRFYAEASQIDPESTPEPKDIFKIGMGFKTGNRSAACEAFRKLGEAVGDAAAQAVSLVDGLIVIGGGLANAWPLFMPALMAEMNGGYKTCQNQQFRRLVPKCFNLEDPYEMSLFLQGDHREINVPGSNQVIFYDSHPRLGIGISKLGTSEAVALGAYAFALEKLSHFGISKVVVNDAYASSISKLL